MRLSLAFEISFTMLDFLACVLASAFISVLAAALSAHVQRYMIRCPCQLILHDNSHLLMSDAGTFALHALHSGPFLGLFGFAFVVSCCIPLSDGVAPG